MVRSLLPKINLVKHALRETHLKAIVFAEYAAKDGVMDCKRLIHYLIIPACHNT